MNGRFLLLFGLAFAAADALASCAVPPEPAVISVDYSEARLTIDESQPWSYLAGLVGKSPNGHQHVYGLTHAEPGYQVRITPRFGKDWRGGAGCALADIAVTLQLTELKIYLARDIPDPCRREIVREHENEHVRVWQQYMRIGARLMTVALRQELAQPRHYENAAGAEEDLFARGKTVLEAKFAELAADVRRAQQEIDTPASYAQLERRMRACPPAR